MNDFLGNTSAGMDDVASRLTSMISGEAPAAEPTGDDAVAARVTATLDPEPAEVEIEVAEETKAEAAEQEVETGTETEAKAETTDAEEALDLSTDDFAQILGLSGEQVSADEDGNLRLRTKINGETGEITVQDLLKSYQTESSVNQRSMALADERKQFEQTQAVEAQALRNKMDEAVSLVGHMEQQLTQEFSAIDWNLLKAQNPAEWSVKRQEFTERYNGLQGIKQQAGAMFQQQQTIHQQQAQVQLEEKLLAESNMLRDKIPEWSDPAVAKTQQDEMRAGLSSHYGFEAEALDNVVDHRLLLVVRDALAYRQSKDAESTAVKKVRTLPKLVKPSPKKTKANVQQATKDAQRIRLRKSGSARDAAAILAGRI